MGSTSSGMVAMGSQVPLVSYLVLGDPPHLVVSECLACGARFFDRRVACAACGAQSFGSVPLPTEGEVRTFTIVSMAAPGIPVPFVAAVVVCGGTSVRANLVHVPADPEHVRTGMRVRLVTVPVGVDAAGTEAVVFGFEPVDTEPLPARLGSGGAGSGSAGSGGAGSGGAGSGSAGSGGAGSGSAGSGSAGSGSAGSGGAGSGGAGSGGAEDPEAVGATPVEVA